MVLFPDSAEVTAVTASEVPCTSSMLFELSSSLLVAVAVTTLTPRALSLLKNSAKKVFGKVILQCFSLARIESVHRLYIG